MVTGWWAMGTGMMGLDGEWVVVYWCGYREWFLSVRDRDRFSIEIGFES